MESPPAISRQPLTSGEVLAALQILFIDQFNFEAPLRADFTVAEVIRRMHPPGSIAELVSALRKAIASAFDVQLDYRNWKELAAETKSPEVYSIPGVNITIGHIAEWVAARTRLPRLIPHAEALPEEAREAVLRGLRRLAQTVWPKHQQVGPDTPLASRFNRVEAREFWTRLRILSYGRVPPLRSGPSTAGGAAEALLVVLAFPSSCLLTSVVVTMTNRTLPMLFNVHGYLLFGLASTFMIFVLSLALLIVGVRRWFNRAGALAKILPEDISTFGDCVLFVTGERRGHCEKCGYNLTGVVSPVCPECGTRWKILED